MKVDGRRYLLVGAFAFSLLSACAKQAFTPIPLDHVPLHEHQISMHDHGECSEPDACGRLDESALRAWMKAHSDALNTYAEASRAYRDAAAQSGRGGDVNVAGSNVQIGLELAQQTNIQLIQLLEGILSARAGDGDPRPTPPPPDARAKAYEAAIAAYKAAGEAAAQTHQAATASYEAALRRSGANEESQAFVTWDSWFSYAWQAPILLLTLLVGATAFGSRYFSKVYEKELQERAKEREEAFSKRISEVADTSVLKAQDASSTAVIKGSTSTAWAAWATADKLWTRRERKFEDNGAPIKDDGWSQIEVHLLMAIKTIEGADVAAAKLPSRSQGNQEIETLLLVAENAKAYFLAMIDHISGKTEARHRAEALRISADLQSRTAADRDEEIVGQFAETFLYVRWVYAQSGREQDRKRLDEAIETLEGTPPGDFVLRSWERDAMEEKDPTERAAKDEVVKRLRGEP